MKEQTGRAASLAVYKSMLGLVRLCSALTVACSIGLNGTLTLMVVIYPTDISLSPANFPGNKVVGIFLLIVGLATSIASAIYFWKAASPTQPKRNGPTLGMFAHCERLMPTVPSQAHHR